MITMKLDSRIYVAGHNGLVGSAIVRKLRELGYSNLIVRSHKELDLTRQSEVEGFFAKEAPEFVVLAAAKVGGIGANSSYPADFIHINLSIAVNVIEAARRYGVKRLLNLGSSCIYPKLAPQPLKESDLLSGHLEPTNEAYAVAKIAAIKMCRYYNEQYGCDFISGMPTNLYGPGDTYDLDNSHVLPAMIRKFHEAKVLNKSVVLWGDGSPLREFLYSEDLAEACCWLLANASREEVGEFINIGSGSELSIAELAGLVAATVGFKGEIEWDKAKPNGTPRKLMDSSRLFGLGWRPKVDLAKGIALSYADFTSRYGSAV